jgi:hypothetical protein
MLLLLSVNADLPFIFGIGFELDFTGNQGKDRVIFTETDVIARMNLSAVLANQDRTRRDIFSGKPFYSQSLTGTVAAVSRATTAFFMSHLKSPLLLFVFLLAWCYDIVDG